VTKPRILIIVNVDWFFMSHRLPIAQAARDAGYDVHVATALTLAPTDIEQHGFTLHPLDIDRRSTSAWQGLKLFMTLRRLMIALKPDVVHLVTIKPVLLGGLAARMARVPRVIAAVSGLGFVFTARGLRAAAWRVMVSNLYRLALARTGVRVVFQNDDDQSLLQRHAGIRTEQVERIRGSGINLGTWSARPMPEDAPLVLMPSRLLLDKGVVEFVEAARRLRGYRHARFVLVGDIDTGNPTSLTHQQIQDWVAEGLVEWWGHRRDMAEVFAQAHLVVLPSYREGLPKALIEAAASGRAVVTTDVPGCRDAIDPGRTGLLVEVRNTEALAQAIRTLLDDPACLRAMGEAGRRWAEQVFDLREVVSRHLTIYGGGPYTP
jgi:glycosyltransferase involved in cell wall biosynthesis